MEFNNIPPEWENKGNEPTEDIKKQGFLAGYKPPAAYFNWFWNKTGACIKELQEKLKGLTKKDVGLDKVDNKSLEEILAEVTMDKANAIDTSGLVGTAQENVKAQQLLDELANRVANKLVEKRMIVNNLTTDNPEMLLAAPMGKELKKQLDEQNKNIDRHLDKNGTYFLAGCPDFIFLELQKELLRLRLQIEHFGEVRLYKSEDGGSTFPTFKTLVTNSDFTWNFASQASLYTKNDSVVFDAYSYVKYNKVLNLCLFYHDWYIKSGTTIGYDEITIATINSNFIPSNGVIASTTIEGARVYINSKIDGTITMAANKIFTLTESTSIRECIIYNMT